jgi:hypothetical protein
LSDFSLEDMVKSFLTIREARERLKVDYEAADAQLEADQDVLKRAMLDVCNNTDAASIKTNSGTVIRRTNERFFCNDWDPFRKFILDNSAIELLERRIHQGNFKQFMADRIEKEGLPPGVNVMREFDVVVRKPTTR